MIKVYIASPYTKGDSVLNVRRQVDKFEELRTLGFMPFAPLLTSHVQHMFFPLTDDEWLEWDFTWLTQCDCVLRLPGVSSGADEEEKIAIQYHIPIFSSMQELCDAYAVEYIKLDKYNAIEDRITGA